MSHGGRVRASDVGERSAFLREGFYDSVFPPVSAPFSYSLSLSPSLSRARARLCLRKSTAAFPRNNLLSTSLIRPFVVHAFLTPHWECEAGYPGEENFYIKALPAALSLFFLSSTPLPPPSSSYSDLESQMQSHYSAGVAAATAAVAVDFRVRTNERMDVRTNGLVNKAFEVFLRRGADGRKAERTYERTTEWMETLAEWSASARAGGRPVRQPGGRAGGRAVLPTREKRPDDTTSKQTSAFVGFITSSMTVPLPSPPPPSQILAPFTRPFKFPWQSMT
ncbi:hypothetical protein Aperf_G00000023047 [Anoplocephala perfoliata]